MTFLDQEITFDIGHLILLLVLVGFVLFVVQRYREGLEIQKVHIRECRCQDCLDVALHQAQTGQLYGCDPNNPYVPYSPEECEYSYRKAALHGCGVAS